MPVSFRSFAGTAGLLLGAALACSAWADDDWNVQTSLLTRHFSPEPDHNNQQTLLNVERSDPLGWSVGGAFFRNTFEQPCLYGYVGRRLVRHLPRDQEVHLKLTAGLLYGYRGEHQDAIPFNRLGVAPAVLPSVGYRRGRLGTEFIVFGLEGFMITAGFYFR